MPGRRAVFVSPLGSDIASVGGHAGSVGGRISPNAHLPRVPLAHWPCTAAVAVPDRGACAYPLSFRSPLMATARSRPPGCAHPYRPPQCPAERTLGGGGASAVRFWPRARARARAGPRGSGCGGGAPSQADIEGGRHYTAPAIPQGEVLLAPVFKRLPRRTSVPSELFHHQCHLHKESSEWRVRMKGGFMCRFITRINDLHLSLEGSH